MVARKCDPWTILSEPELLDLVRRVQCRIVCRYAGHVPDDEAFGYAQLGVVQAGKTLQAKYLGPRRHPSFVDRLKRRLACKGFYNAVDQMRSDKVVDRKVKGRVVKRNVDAMSFAEMSGGEFDEPGDFNFDPHDEQALSPAAVAEVNDLVRHCKSVLSLTERELVRYRYECRLSMKQIGMVLAVSEPRVSQMHSQALRKLREAVVDPSG